MLTKKSGYALAILAGLTIGFMSPQILSYTSAIAIPAGYLNAFGGAWPLAMVLWEWLIVRVPAYGLLGAAAIWLVVRFSDAAWLALCVIVILSEVVTVVWIMPALSGYNTPAPILWQGMALHLAALIPAVLLVGFFESRRV